MIKIYTDGSCYKNPGPGGWAAIILKDNNQKIISGKQKNTTNNQMELTAAIKALEYFSQKQEVVIFTDSNYVKEGITNWIKVWKKKDWKNSKKKPVKNIDLWKKLEELDNFHKVKWKWVKAHSNNLLNNLVDRLAKKSVKK